MNKIKENLYAFFTIWGVILVLNQVILFGGCFNPICLIAALPHTGVISFVISIFVIADEEKNRKKSQAKEAKFHATLDKQKTSIVETNIEINKDEDLDRVYVYSSDDLEKNWKALMKAKRERSKIDIQPNKLDDFDSEYFTKLKEINTLQQYQKEYKALYSELIKLNEQKKYLQNKRDLLLKRYFQIAGTLQEKLLMFKKNISIEDSKKYKDFINKYKNIKEFTHINIDGYTFDDTIDNHYRLKLRLDDLQSTITKVKDIVDELNKSELVHLANQITDVDRFYAKEKQNILNELIEFLKINNALSISNISDLPFISNQKFEFMVLINKNQYLIILIDNDLHQIRYPKNNTWSNIVLKSRDVCLVEKIPMGNNNRLNLLKVNNKAVGSPINFIKENITFESLEFKKDINILSENKLEVIKEDSNYSKALKNIENSNFEKIRRYCNNLLNDNKADEMQKYLAENGKMHKALIYDALEQFISKLDKKTITLVDWGCGQGIGSSLVLDYIKEKQLNIKIEKVVLIDDNEKFLSRAMVQVEALAQDNIKLIPIKSDDNNISDTIKSSKNNIVLNLFINDNTPIDFFDFDLFDENYFLCLSNQNNNFINKVYENISIFSNVQNMSIRDTKIGKFKKFERIFKKVK